MHDKPKLSFFIFGISKVMGCGIFLKIQFIFWVTKEFVKVLKWFDDREISHGFH